jgi:SAM-dependent methyltransferase
MDTEQGHDTEYMPGHSPRELERLINQAQLYEPLTTQFFRDAGITAGMRVLDVGCGAGDVSFLAARMVGPTGHVVGVDRSPVAVATAGARARHLDLPNTRFVVGEAGEMAFTEPFDAAVGRFMLTYCPDPSLVVRQVVAQVRTGGVIAFQEPDCTGCRSFPVVPTFSRCARWVAEALERSGADPYVGMKLFATFTSAGLPPPTLSEQATIAAGPDHPLYAVVAETVRTVLPALEQQGIATADEVAVDTLAVRLRDEVVTSGATVIWVPMVGAASRKAAQL